MNWKLCWRKQLWINLTHYPGIFLQGPKPQKTSARPASLDQDLNPKPLHVKQAKDIFKHYVVCSIWQNTDHSQKNFLRCEPYLGPLHKTGETKLMQARVRETLILQLPQTDGTVLFWGSNGLIWWSCRSPSVSCGAVPRKWWYILSWRLGARPCPSHTCYWMHDRLHDLHS